MTELVAEVVTGSSNRTSTTTGTEAADRPRLQMIQREMVLICHPLLFGSNFVANSTAERGGSLLRVLA